MGGICKEVSAAARAVSFGHLGAHYIWSDVARLCDSASPPDATWTGRLAVRFAGLCGVSRGRFLIVARDDEKTSECHAQASAPR